MNKLSLNIIKLFQDLTPWFLRQSNRLQFIWTKNKPIMDDLEKWDRLVEESVAEASYTSQTLSFQAYISKKISDFYLLYPLQSSVISTTGTLTNTGLTGFSISGSSSSIVRVKIEDVLGRGFIDATKIRLRCYVQPTSNNKTPYVALYDLIAGTYTLVSDMVGLSGGWNDIVLTLISNSDANNTYLSYTLSSGQTYIVKDMGIYYERTADAVIDISERTLDEYYIYNDNFILNEPTTYEYPLFQNDTKGWSTITYSGNTNVTSVTTGFTSKVMSVGGNVGSGGGEIILNTNYWLNSGYTAFIPYGGLHITGNTSVSFSIGYFVGGVWIELDSQGIFTYFENDIINLSGYTTAHNLSFKISFSSSVIFSIDLMVGNKTGIVYNGLPDASSGGIVIIYIDDKDYADAQIKYINDVIKYKKPVGVTYSLESF